MGRFILFLGGLYLLLMGVAFSAITFGVMNYAASNTADLGSIPKSIGYGLGVGLFACMALGMLVLGITFIYTGYKIRNRSGVPEDIPKNKHGQPRRYPPKRGYDESSDSYY